MPDRSFRTSGAPVLVLLGALLAGCTAPSATLPSASGVVGAWRLIDAADISEPSCAASAQRDEIPSQRRF
jgi:hypothetical protein